MKSEKNKKKILPNVNTDGIKNLLKSKEVRNSVKEAIKAVKEVTDAFGDI